MAGQRNRVVVAVIGNLTENQAAQMTKQILRDKDRYAPHGTGTIASGSKSDVGRLLRNGHRRAVTTTKNH